MKKNLLVTLADEKYVDQAKQLFSSAYWNGGWKGDYMLLAHEIPEEKLKWFRNKGILIKKCKTPIKDDLFSPRWPNIVFCKFLIFTPEFKKWENVIFLDADIIVKYSLEALVKIKGLRACIDLRGLKDQFLRKNNVNKNILKKYSELEKDLKKNYNLKDKEDAFNSGVMVFSTDIIKENAFDSLISLFDKYKDIAYSADQPILNLFFYKKWKELPLVYNLRPNEIKLAYKIKPPKINGIIFHFCGTKPWDKKSTFYNKWESNLKKAEKIDLKKIPKTRKLDKETIKEVSQKLRKKYPKKKKYFKIKDILLKIDKNIGEMGIKIRNLNPRVYHILKTPIKLIRRTKIKVII